MDHLDRKVPSAPTQPGALAYPTLLSGLFHFGPGLCGSQLLVSGGGGGQEGPWGPGQAVLPHPAPGQLPLGQGKGVSKGPLVRSSETGCPKALPHKQTTEKQ